MHASKGNNFAGSISNKYEGLAGLPVRNQSCCFAYVVFQIVSTKEAAKRLILWASDFGTLPSGLVASGIHPLQMSVCAGPPHAHVKSLSLLDRLILYHVG